MHVRNKCLEFTGVVLFICFLRDIATWGHYSIT